MNKEAVAKMRSGALSLGTWLSTGSPVVTEVAAGIGFDWLLIDLEHGCATEDSLLQHLQAIRGTGSAAIVRVGAPRDELILRVLDWGADGIMVPRVSTPEEAERCVAAVNYPPRGHRGFSRSARAYGYGARPPSSEDLETPPFLMLQIETIEGAANAAQIANIDGVDALFVGPSDLRFQIDRSQPPGIDYDQCLHQVAKAAAEAGKPWGILLRTPEEAATHHTLGASLIALDSDLAVLRRGFTQTLHSVRSAAARPV